MQLMDRDRLLLTDLALHHVMTRTQIVALGFFASPSRANARLLKLRRAGLIRQVEPSPLVTARQFIYTVGKRAAPILDERVARLLTARSFTPRHIDHALATVEIRCVLVKYGLERWWAEPQVRHTYEVRYGGSKRVEDVRPDGLALIQGRYLYIETCRGNVSLDRFKEKFASYRTYLDHGVFQETFGAETFDLLVVTTAAIRQRHLLSVVPATLPFRVSVVTQDRLAAASSLEEVLRQ